MTNENPRGLPVAWRIVWSPGERFGQPEVTTDCSRVMDIRQLTNAPRIDALILATDYAALLVERDAAERIGLELQGRAQRAEVDAARFAFCVERDVFPVLDNSGVQWVMFVAVKSARRSLFIGDTPAEAIDAAISAMEGRE